MLVGEVLYLGDAVLAVRVDAQKRHPAIAVRPIEFAEPKAIHLRKWALNTQKGHDDDFAILEVGQGVPRASLIAKAEIFDRSTDPILSSGRRPDQAISPQRHANKRHLESSGDWRTGEIPFGPQPGFARPLNPF
jgi:hypothetical protein